MLAFSLQPPLPHRALHSFPTRRSSDLGVCMSAVSVAAAPLVELRGVAKRFGAAQPPGPVGRALRKMGLTQPPVVTHALDGDRKSTRLNSSHVSISYAVFCLKKKR